MNKLVSPFFLFLMLFACSLITLLDGFVSKSTGTTFQLAGSMQDQKLDVDNGAVSIALNKMNVFYIGVENPISVAASGLGAEDLSLSAENLRITKTGLGTYSVLATSPGTASIKVVNQKTGESVTEQFRIKRIPDPIIEIGGISDGLMGSGEMAAQTGMTAKMPNFVFDARCNIQSYTMYYTRRNSDPVQIEGSGARFTGRSLTAIQQAKPGDQYAFTNIRARCPGDKSGRRINGMAFKIR